jgi:hypothetical protein
MIMLLHGVVAAFAPGIAAQDAPGAKANPLDRAMDNYRLTGVFGAGRIIAAGVGEKRADDNLIDPDNARQYFRDRFDHLIFEIAFFKSSIISVSSPGSLRNLIIIHLFDGHRGLLFLRNSRIIRLTRLRLTALPNLRETLIPNRVGLPSATASPSHLPGILIPR